MFRKIFSFTCLLFPLLSLSQNKIDLLILYRDYDGAMAAINEQLNQKPDAGLFFRKSMILKRQMLYPEALQELNNAVSLDSLNTSYLEERADLYESLGNYDSAINDYKNALLIDPNDMSAKFNMGQTYIRITEYDNAVNIFSDVYKADSTNVIYTKYFALAAYKAEKYRLAVSLYEKYIVLNPNDLTAYLNMSRAYGEMKEDSAAFKTLILAKQKFPDNKTVDLRLANSLFVWKKYEKACQSYKDYMAKYDTTIPVLTNYGICLYYTRHEQEAINELEKCYCASPNDPFINFYLGASHKRLAEYDLAAKYIEFAIYISMPEFLPEMYHHLGLVYGNMREFEKSVEALKKAYELDIRKVEILFEIATTYEEFNSDKTLALHYYNSYLKEAGESGSNADYALSRINMIREKLFFDK